MNPTDREWSLMRALWDVYGILGFDQDGDATPAVLAAPTIEKLVTDAALEYRKDEAESEAELVAEVDRLRSLLTDRDAEIAALDQDAEGRRHDITDLRSLLADARGTLSVIAESSPMADPPLDLRWTANQCVLRLDRLDVQGDAT